jgi:hypothetical protein
MARTNTLALRWLWFRGQEVNHENKFHLAEAQALSSAYVLDKRFRITLAVVSWTTDEHKYTFQ